ncbi:MAG: hypothetical protein JWO40_499 [Candidatus Doudnabacteria bacterium]|nr:hypothetical protein [Candidatus Doudnabacteria bacterium]
MHVQSKTHRAISVIAISLISFVGLELLVYINNLYLTQTYIMVSFYIYFFMLLWLYFIFDLHFKDRDYLDAKTITRTIGRRFKHFAVWENFRYFQNFLILPGLLYWGSIVLIGINFGHLKLQHFIAVTTSLALVVAYSLFKEVFHQKQAPITNSHFVMLTYIKVYASWLVYAGSLGIVWYYCFKPIVFYVVVFLVTLMLLYQALFQFCKITLQNLGLAVLVSLVMALTSFFVYQFWNVNYFSAGLFLMAFYNFLWNILYHLIKKTLNGQVFLEQLTIFILIVVMVFGVTNFKAKIERCVFY